MQGRIVPTDQKHHPRYEYSFPGGDFEKYGLDEWFTRKTPAPLAYAAALTTDGLNAIIDAWNPAHSIFDDVNTALIGSAVWGPTPGVERGFDTTVDIHDPVAASADGRLFAKHFLSLQENVALRDRDIAANLPQDMKLTSTYKTSRQRNFTGKAMTPVWTNVLKEARAKLREQLRAGTPAPANKDDARLVDNAVLASHDAALTTYRDLGLLRSVGGEAKFEKKVTTGAGAERGTHAASWPLEKKVKFNFGLGHLSVTTWMEWRAMTELAQAIAAAEKERQPIAAGDSGQ